MGRWGRRPRLGAALASATLAALAGGATADAATVTVGSPLTATFNTTPAGVGPGTAYNSQLPEPEARITSPVDGVIVRWRLVGAAGGPFSLRVLRPAAGAFTGAGTSAPVIPASTSLQIFSASLPIHSGDVVAIDYTSPSDALGAAPLLPGATATLWVPPLADGATSPPTNTSPVEIGFNADVQPPPTLESVNPASGSYKGGTKVTIAGRDLSGATAVTFGGAAATFSVDSDAQITATAPPGRVGLAPVVVSNVAGQTHEDLKFQYLACFVPKLRHKTLKAAKRKLRRAHCKLGKVRRRHGARRKTGRIVKQRPKPRSQRPPGAKVTVVLAPARRHR